MKNNTSKNVWRSVLLWLGVATSINGAVAEVERTQFTERFNPIMGMTTNYETDYRSEVCLNGSWQFMPEIPADTAKLKQLPTTFVAESVPLKIPSPWNINSYYSDNEGGQFTAYPSYPDSWKSVTMGWMKREITMDNIESGDEYFLHFEGVMGKSCVYVNGIAVGENFDLFLPFEFNITHALKAGTNEIVIGVCKASLYNEKNEYGTRTYVGGSQFAKAMAGIWQDVYLFTRPKLHVSDIFVKPNVSADNLTFDVTVTNLSSQSQTFDLEADVRKWINEAGTSTIDAPVEKWSLASSSVVDSSLSNITLVANESKVVSLTIPILNNELHYWTPEQPNLYGSLIYIKQNNKSVDCSYERFGWREFTISGTDLLLNGEKIVLKGDSWHFNGMPLLTRRYAWAWYTMLKDAGANAVRPHAQPYPSFYLDMADEMGICVLDETGIWASDGGPKVSSENYWSSCADHVERLIKRDKNHASVFGWSVCNEVLPVVINVYHAPENIVQRQVDEINRWVAIAQSTDPTRQWISGDGETMRETDLPTVIGHYGGINAPKEWSEKGKPWGVGETSMAYFGTPLQISVYNGNSAYESMEKRLEGLSIECYDLLKSQQEYDACYQSVFNIAWYALTPLNLGKADKSTTPTDNEGVFFTYYEEGMPGMQPEKIGAYTTTFNPGYDPQLPLYITNPMFDGIKAANIGEEMPTYTVKEVIESSSSTLSISSVKVIDADDSLIKMASSLGLEIDSENDYSESTLIWVDASQLNTTLVGYIKDAIAAKSPLYITGVSQQTLSLLNEALPKELELTPYRATSFVTSDANAIINGMGNSDFYFSELLTKDGTVLTNALGGAFAQASDSLLLTCKAEWHKWSYRQEPVKTSAVFRSQWERNTELPVMLYYNEDNQNIFINSIDLSELKPQELQLTKRLFTNLGLTVEIKETQVLDTDGRMLQMQHTSATVSKVTDATTLLNQAILMMEGATTSTVEQWTLMQSDEGVFDFSELGNSVQATVHYLSFWLYSPRSLSDLLAEPDMPQLDIIVDGLPSAILLNGTRYNVTDNKLSAMQIDKGWNQIVVKLVQQPNTAPSVLVQLETITSYLESISVMLNRDSNIKKIISVK